MTRSSNFTSLSGYIRTAYTAALTGLLILFSVISLSSFAENYIFLCQLLSHLQLIWLGIIGLLCLCLLAAHRPRWSMIGAIVWSINFIPVGALWIPAQRPNSDEIIATGKSNAKSKSSIKEDLQEKNISILMSNAWGAANKNYARTCQLVRENAPDVVGLSEVTPDWISALRAGLPEYKYVIAEPSFGGIALLSKFPIKSGGVKHFGLNPRIEAVVDFDDNNNKKKLSFNEDVLIICMHPDVPMTPEQLKLRNGELDEVAGDAVAANLPVIVFGDMNCTPFSSYFKRFVKQSRLLDTEQGFGVQPTWNALLAVPFIPIDHCFASKEFITRERRVTTPSGSDHAPVFVKLSKVHWQNNFTTEIPRLN